MSFLERKYIMPNKIFSTPWVFGFSKIDTYNKPTYYGSDIKAVCSYTHSAYQL